MLDQLSRFTILKLSFKESMLEHQSGGKATKRKGMGEEDRVRGETVINWQQAELWMQDSCIYAGYRLH